ncbi:MAG: hypothetical protein WD135_00600 [Ferruginibacter sp.]
MKYVFFVLGLFLLYACSASYRFNKDKVAFNASKETMIFKSVADMNDAYFVIKENNFFEFYRELFDSIKNTRYPGKYELKNDTLLLKFYNNKGVKLIGNKAVIDSAKNHIVLIR